MLRLSTIIHLRSLTTNEISSFSLLLAVIRKLDKNKNKLGRMGKRFIMLNIRNTILMKMGVYQTEVQNRMKLIRRNRNKKRDRKGRIRIKNKGKLFKKGKTKTYEFITILKPIFLFFVIFDIFL